MPGMAPLFSSSPGPGRRKETQHPYALSDCRVGHWPHGLGQCLCSLFARPFVCGCHNISPMSCSQRPLVKPCMRCYLTRLSPRVHQTALRFRLAVQYSALRSSHTPRYRVVLALSGTHRCFPSSDTSRFLGSFPQVELCCLDPASGTITRSESLSPGYPFVGLTYR